MSDGAREFAAFPYTAPERPTITRTPATHHPLTDVLGAAVPFLIHDLVQQGGPSDADWAAATAFGEDLAYRGDVLLYGGKKGEAAKLFANLVRSIAVLAFKEGGIDTFGTHYEAYLREPATEGEGE